MQATATAEGGPVTRNSTGYQALLVGLLSLNFGIVFFDRNSLNFLMPFVQPDLHLSNSQVGYVAGIFSFIWAIAAFGVSRVSDVVGNRKLLLVIATVAFSACSFLTGLAASFAMLIGARIVMGIAEGGVMPISHAMVASEVSPKYRGLAQGIAQNFGSNFFGSFVAPVVLVALAGAYGWRSAFYIAGIPGIISAGLIWFLLKEPEKAVVVAPVGPRKSTGQAVGDYLKAVGQALKIRNVLICVLMGIVLVAYLVITWAFMPLYLTQVRGYSQTEQSWLMSVLGISATLGSFLTAGLSDVIGRRPVMIVTPLLSLLLPLGAMYYHGPYFGMVVIFFFGWALNGIFPLFMATVPSESVPPAMAATVFGLCMGSCEIIGGAGGPAIAGIAADAYGLQAPLWMMAGLTLVGFLFALFLRESAPGVLAKRGAAPA
ncbi:MAG: MFS transporter [Candidatus Andeanibacterium colombiense]|uniref:MFS transporter n=1 Tax=Candidatus Andeanibacterium colombiense TaxID=3121345 RepID=A0AAJ6BQD3_9SPHN|nr:MAG: MFS transporter [Sphingomonadaceae bacterium]